VRLGRISAVIFCTLALEVSAATPAEQHFIEKVKPLLDSRCVSCHGPDKVKAGLRLDSRPAVLKGGESGPAMVPGKPAESLLLQAVMHTKKDLEMPPKEKLTTNDVAVLRQWIVDGAPWPEATSRVEAASILRAGERIGDAWTDSRNPIVRIFGGQRLDLWSVKPLRHVEPPAVTTIGSREARKEPKTGTLLHVSRFGSAGTFVRNPIDQFVLAKLREHGLEPAPEASRRTLARRLSFDLTGLPPTPEETDEFVNDPRPDAYEQLVDKLLASPRYGEQAAREWMDVIRYSDSNGFDWDEFRPKAWRFRDYLIRSFNADKPFDRMIREQLAGDELVDGAPTNEAEQDCLIATGYLRLGPQDNSAGAFNEQARSRSELLTDLTETTSSAFLGLTMACCRCHNHKYDPLSQADHYRLRAFFEPVKFGDDIPLDLRAEQEAIRAQNKAIDEEINPIKKQREELLAAVKKRLRDAKAAKLSPDERAAVEVAREKRTDEQKKKAEAAEKKVELKEKEVTAALVDAEKKQNEALTKQVDALTKKKRAFTTGLLASDKPDKVAVTKILFQGDYKAEREAVEPGFMSILDPNPARIEKPRNAKTTGRRLSLADWIASTNNPLTARVFVNRLWQSHFGEGLVATPNDFGLAGARPTHAELLDWLAGEFMRGGWSVKQMHKLIVMSGTYRQATVIADGEASRGEKTDRENNFLWRQNLKRLSAEQLRDAVLATAGTLRLDHRGGPPVWPDLPPEIAQSNPAFLDDNAEKTKAWYPSPKTNQNVRSVFLIQKRTVRVPFLETFDLPENTVSCPRRNESIVAPQALSLLNSELAVESARAFAERVNVAAGEDAARQVDWVFKFALQRRPADDERRAALDLLKSRSLAELCRALMNVNEFVWVD